MTASTPRRTAAPPVVQPGLPTSPPLAGRPGPHSSPPGPAPGQPGGGSSSSLPCITASRGADFPAVGRPEPAPGAVATCPATAPGRGRAPSPARDGLPVPREVADPSLAGSTGRTFTIPLPAGLKLLNLNDRIHFAERYRRTQELKKAAWAVARHKKIPLSIASPSSWSTSRGTAGTGTPITPAQRAGKHVLTASSPRACWWMMSARGTSSRSPAGSVSLTRWGGSSCT